ncbi:MAG: 23S rRNA (pseudouridine(1915)-N(3))-methyltransferase RlmH [Oscillospiraceae bacterium]|nr:23S rRNA (pseudouridine(1915)-N(3))-methyltransferase RlmH [Oscillospiraceae bacterium]
MLKINIIAVGGLRERYWQMACDEYAKRMSSMCKLTVYEERDDAAILARLAKDSRGHAIALCVEGKQLSSQELAEEIAALSVGGVSTIAFVIGGAEGLSEEVKAKCNRRLSFSPMTFPHQLARVLLTEQIYRALNIIGGGNYHK